MWVQETVYQCDFTDREYPRGALGAGAVARGNTGRHCVVMWAGPEYVAKNNITLMSKEEAREQIDNNGSEGDYADF